MLFFGHRQLERPIAGAVGQRPAEFAHYGTIAHQPLTVGIVMYLAVFIAGRPDGDGHRAHFLDEDVAAPAASALHRVR